MKSDADRHGTTTRRQVIDTPDNITLEDISDEGNIERRRVLLERFGLARFVKGSNAQIIDEDRRGVLYRCPVLGDEPIVMVKVINRTPEPDGTFKEYLLRVPPTTTSARAAVAWTFHMSKQNYRPTVET